MGRRWWSLAGAGSDSRVCHPSARAPPPAGSVWACHRRASAHGARSRGWPSQRALVARWMAHCERSNGLSLRQPHRRRPNCSSLTLSQIKNECMTRRIRSIGQIVSWFQLVAIDLRRRASDPNTRRRRHLEAPSSFDVASSPSTAPSLPTLWRSLSSRAVTLLVVVFSKMKGP